jgi:hypothetical protein
MKKELKVAFTMLRKVHTHGLQEEAHRRFLLAVPSIKVRNV